MGSFSIPVKPAEIELSLEVMADDRIEAITLNDVVLSGGGSSVGGFRGPPLRVLTTDVNKFKYGTGQNNLRLRVFDDHGFKTGLITRGKIRACLWNSDPGIPAIPSNCPRGGDRSSWTNTVTANYQGHTWYCAYHPMTSFKESKFIPIEVVDAMGFKIHEVGSVISGSRCAAFANYSICGDKILNAAGAFPNWLIQNRGWTPDQGDFIILDDLAINVSGDGVDPLPFRKWADTSWHHGGAEGYVVERYAAHTKKDDKLWVIDAVNRPDQGWVRFVTPRHLPEDCGNPQSGCP